MVRACNHVFCRFFCFCTLDFSFTFDMTTMSYGAKPQSLCCKVCMVFVKWTLSGYLYTTWPGSIFWSLFQRPAWRTMKRCYTAVYTYVSISIYDITLTTLDEANDNSPVNVARNFRKVIIFEYVIKGGGVSFPSAIHIIGHRSRGVLYASRSVLYVTR